MGAVCIADKHPLVRTGDLPWGEPARHRAFQFVNRTAPSQAKGSQQDH